MTGLLRCAGHSLAGGDADPACAGGRVGALGGPVCWVVGSARGGQAGDVVGPVEQLSSADEQAFGQPGADQGGLVLSAVDQPLPDEFAA